MSSKKKPVSLAEKISSLVTAVPTSFGSDDESEETKAKVVDYDDEIDDLDDFKAEFNSSNIRKRNVNLLEEENKRYSGKKVSRKQIFNEDESSEGEEDDDAEEDDEDEEDGDDSDASEDNNEGNGVSDSEQEEDASLKSDGRSSDGENEDNDSKEDDDESDVEDDYGDASIDLSNPLRRNRDPGITTISASNVRQEVEKGNCVREQLKLWENLLEMRIKLQKCLISSNKLPQYNSYKNYESNEDFKGGCKDTKVKLTGLLTNLLQLQSNLLQNFPETKNVLSKGTKRKANDKGEESDENDDPMDEEIASDTEDEMNENESEEEEGEESEKEDKKGPPKKKMKLSEFENILAKNHKAYAEYRDSVIQKWNDKTRIASGVISKGANQPAVKQIQFALSNKDKLLKKTQLKRSEYNIIGKAGSSVEENDGRRTQEYDPEIYDDDDFYHQLLRELIEYKSADITDPIQLSKQWIQLQNMRSKMKRKIDTRATKGRRIRYNVHQKLVNYMAPITAFDTWTDHSKDELYRSLFGKKNLASKKDEDKPT